MKPLRRKPSSKDANFPLPHDLTPLIRKHLLLLEPSPKADYLQEQVFSKFVSADTASPEVRRQSAIRKWLATERNNDATNVRLLTICEEYNILPRVQYSDFMDKVREYVLRVLGDTPPVEALYGAFSGGASTSRSRVHSHPARKYLGKADVTARALEWGDEVLASSSLWSTFRGGLQFSTVEGNILFTVPKNANIDRVAAKEPDINMYLQKGVGNFIRRRLRAFGIDLNNQSNNQKLAKIGSQTGGFATIDLSSASDSMTTELVFQCVPICWYTLLDSLRCHVTVIDGDPHENEMFSSMGNGFTFELESLLFWAVAKATAWFNRCERMPLLVYGDDIIVPTAIADQLIFALSILGFTTNEDKTFTSGPFRESCGGHYYNGRDISPFYIKEPVTRLVDAIHVCNQIREWSNSGFCILEDDLSELWALVASHVPKCFWGGFDVADKTRLVSYERPIKPKRLLPLKGKPVDLGHGGYLLWLNSTEGRCEQRFETFVLDPDSLQTSQERTSYASYRSKRASTSFWYQGDLFLHEVHPPIADATSVPG